MTRRFLFVAALIALGSASGALAASKSMKHHSANPAYDVYTGTGQYVGSDPDPRVRSQLLRDAHPY